MRGAMRLLGDVAWGKRVKIFGFGTVDIEGSRMLELLRVKCTPRGSESL